MKAGWPTLAFEQAVSSRGSGAQGLPQSEWKPEGAYPVIGQGEGDIEGWTDRADLLLTPTPANVLYGGHTRRAKLVTQPFVPGPNVKILSPCARLNPAFLYYFLQWLPIESKGYADHFPLVRKAVVPVPPLPEQRRIVAILDEAFEGIAKAKANAEKNIENARELVARYRDDSFSALGALSPIRRLRDVCAFENGDRGKNYPSKQHRVAHGVPFINAGHLSQDGLDFSEMDYISVERFNLLGNGKVRPGDILFCLRGSLGKHASVGDLKQGAVASSLVILRPTSAALDEAYLLAFLASSGCAAQVEMLKGGAAQPNLGARDLQQFQLPIPSLSEQKDFANRVNELRDGGRVLQERQERKLAALDELKKSLLHHAFAEEL